jgi:tetratricopeptide (TPR) repeat protein
VLGRFGEDIDAALALIDRALALNPSFAHAWYWSGWLRLFAGDIDLAIQHFETSMRLNPRGQRGFHLSGIGMAHFLNRRFDDALAVLRVSLEEVPIFTADLSVARSLLRPYGSARGSTVDHQADGVSYPRAVRLTRSATRSTASFSYPVCAWRPARRHEPDPPSRRDPRQPRATFAIAS